MRLGIIRLMQEVVTLRLVVSCGLLLIGCSRHALADQEELSLRPQVVPTETVVAAETVAATATESVFAAAVSRAYMNCLRDADENAAELIKNPRARDSEVQYMQKFCDGRRESCIAKGDDAQCKLFIEDYAQ